MRPVKAFAISLPISLVAGAVCGLTAAYFADEAVLLSRFNAMIKTGPIAAGLIFIVLMVILLLRR